MTDFVIVAGKQNSLMWNGASFSRDADKAKTYATEPAAKRAMNKVADATGRTGLKIMRKADVGRSPSTAEAPSKKKRAA